MMATVERVCSMCGLGMNEITWTDVDDVFYWCRVCDVAPPPVKKKQ